MNFFEDNSSINKKSKDKEKNDEDDLVQEKPEDYNGEDNININNESNNNDIFFKSKEESINNNNSINKKNDEDEIGNQKLKESETLKDSYCDLIVKNLDEYRNICNS